MPAAFGELQWARGQASSYHPLPAGCRQYIWLPRRVNPSAAPTTGRAPPRVSSPTLSFPTPTIINHSKKNQKRTRNFGIMSALVIPMPVLISSTPPRAPAACHPFKHHRSPAWARRRGIGETEKGPSSPPPISFVDPPLPPPPSSPTARCPDGQLNAVRP